MKTGKCLVLAAYRHVLSSHFVVNTRLPSKYFDN